MSASLDAPSARIIALWRRLAGWPGGRWLFSWMIGWMAPYTGTIGARALELEPGHSRWSLRDRRRVRNHLNSIHAVALVNLAEVASGTAMLAALPPGTRGIVRGLSIEYLKKARGTLIAECRCSPPSAVADQTDYEVTATIRDSAGDTVATARVVWRLAPESIPAVATPHG
ncbi:MAG: hotdog fold domain-containing protein [Gemmatimonadaceae bacterium]